MISTGPFQNPVVPKFSNKLSENVLQLHSSQYENSEHLREGPALVVGGGNSGAQIAVELSKERETYLSISHKIKFLPQLVMNKSIFWWFDKLGIYKASTNTKIGQYI